MKRTIWAEKIARVNLDDHSVQYVPRMEFGDFSLGGRGIGQLELFQQVEPGIGPYDSENVISFSAGALVGTMTPAACRLAIDTKNAFTGGICSSNLGGHFAPELKYAGFDSVIVSGKSTEPVYLWINDSSVEICDASSIWGLDTWETNKILREKYHGNNIRVLSIGPAGENLVRGACVIGDWARAGGRGGAGAVMGSKKLKAIAVSGTGELVPANKQEFLRQVRRCSKILDRSYVVQKYRAGGTMVDGAGGKDGTFPQAVRNSQDAFWPLEKSRKIYEPTLKEQHELRRLGCFNCPINCGHYYVVSEGPYAGSSGEGFQINTGRAFGSNLDIDNPEAIIAAHNYCSRMGLDVDMAGACLAFAFEAYQRGDLSRSEANGLDLTWGNDRAAYELLQSIVERRGLGDLLAEGVMIASGQLGRGSTNYALHVKGADLNETAVRPFKAWALGIILSNRGGGHLDGSPFASAWNGHEELAEELFDNPQPGAPGEYHNQAKFVIWHEKYKAVVDMLGVCYFTSRWLDAELLSPDDYVALLSAGSGIEYSTEEIMQRGKKLHALEKAFNTLHTGHTREQDQPPQRWQEPIKSGPYRGEKLELEGWQVMLDEYYQEKGWDMATGWQTEASLNALGLEGVASKLRKHGYLK